MRGKKFNYQYFFEDILLFLPYFLHKLKTDCLISASFSPIQSYRTWWPQTGQVYAETNTEDKQIEIFHSLCHISEIFLFPLSSESLIIFYVW